MEEAEKEQMRAAAPPMFSNADLRRLIAPLVVEQGLTFLVGVADSMMVSYAGEAAMSGVSLVDMYAMLMQTVMAAIGSGGAVVVSQYIGHGDQKKANLAASQLMMLAGLISTVLMVFTLAGHRGILHLFYPRVEEDVMQAAMRYLWITAFSFPFLGIYNSAAALFRSMGMTKRTMQVSLLMNVINIVGNAIGIFVLHAGVAGVAVPTLISRMVAGIVMSRMAFSEKNKIFINWREILHWNSEYVKRVLHIAVPNGIENGLFSLGRMLVTSVVSLFGTSQIAASAAALSVGTIAIIVCSANNLAIVTVVGQCVGAGEYDQAAYYMKKILKISFVGVLIMTVVMEFALPLILGMYDLTPEAYHYATILVTIHNVGACFIHPFSFNMANGLRATGDARFTMLVGMVSMIFFRVGAAVFFGILLNFQVMGVWFAMLCDWAARSTAFLWRFKSGKWREYRAI